MDNKTYYYMKLKDDFFNDDRIIAMESMENGLLYSNILIKLYLKSLKYDGKLMMTEKIPYTAERLAAVLHVDIKDMQVALELFQELGFVADVNGVYWMEEIQYFVGKSSTEADRVRAYRDKKKAKSKVTNEQVNTDLVVTNEIKDTDNVTGDVTESKDNCTTGVVTSGVQMYDKCTPENKSIDKKKNISKDISKEKPQNVLHVYAVSETNPSCSSDKNQKKHYGTHKRVLLTDRDMAELCEEHGEAIVRTSIDLVDDWAERLNIQRQDSNYWSRQVGEWGRKAAKKQHNKTPPSANAFTSMQMHSDYNMDELEKAIISN